MSAQSIHTYNCPDLDKVRSVICSLHGPFHLQHLAKVGRSDQLHRPADYTGDAVGHRSRLEQQGSSAVQLEGF